MARPPLPVGAHGSITTKELPSGRVKARARVRDHDGTLRYIERTAASKTAAITALKAAVADRDPLPDFVDIAPSTTVAVLGRSWVAGLRTEGQLRPQTIDTYERVVTGITRALGDLRLQELSAGRIERFLKALTPGASAEAAKVLRLMLDTAVRHDAIRHNPARQAVPAQARKTEVQVITLAEIADLRHRVGLWLAGEIDDAGKPRARKRSGPAPRPDLLDIIDLFLATGVRTSELLATDWADVDLAAVPPTLAVTGTLVYVNGRGLVRQEAPKTESGSRVLSLPPFGAEVLQRRADERRAGMVFPSEADGYLSPANVGRVWRRARTAAGYPGVELRTLRRTVATAISQAEGVEAAAAQLGHSGTLVTRRHYIARSASRAPIVRLHLNGKTVKYVTTFAEPGAGTREDIETVVDLYRLTEPLRAAIRRYESA